MLDFDRFTHTLLREALYSRLSLLRRVRLHHRIGEAIEGLSRRDPSAHLAELAHHFLQAASGGDTDKAISYAKRAGDRALSQLAYEEASAYYDSALEIIESGDDAFCLKATSPLPCRNIIASGCKLSTKCNAIKLGTESLGRSHRSKLGKSRLQYCIDLMRELATIPGVAGVHIMAPGNEGAIAEVIKDAAGLKRAK